MPCANAARGQQSAFSVFAGGDIGQDAVGRRSRPRSLNLACCCGTQEQAFFQIADGRRGRRQAIRQRSNDDANDTTSRPAQRYSTRFDAQRARRPPHARGPALLQRVDEGEDGVTTGGRPQRRANAEGVPAIVTLNETYLRPEAVVKLRPGWAQ